MSRWDKLFNEGRRLYKNKQFSEAMKKYQEAWRLDDSPAKLSFALGQCAYAAGDPKTASEYYILARDRDTLRFRADSRINSIIRTVAKTGGQSVCLADLEQQLSAQEPGELLGEGLLLDHVHLNFRGNFLAALTAARSLDKVIPGLKIQVPIQAGEIRKLETALQQRLMYDARARYDLAVIMYRRKALPPFVGQLDHKEEMSILRDKLTELRKAVTQVPPADVERNYLAAISQSPTDAVLAARLSDFQVKYGRISQAIIALESALKSNPHSVLLRRRLSVAMAISGQVDKGVALLTSPDNPFQWDKARVLEHMGSGLIKSGRPMRSESLYEQLLELDEDHLDALVNMGAVMTRKGLFDRADEYLNRAVKINPQRVDALGNIANSFIKRGDAGAAGKWLARAIAAGPYDDMARLAMGAHQALRESDVDKGAANLRRCIELNPTSVTAYRLLARIHLGRGQAAEAQRYNELALLFSGP